MKKALILSLYLFTILSISAQGIQKTYSGLISEAEALYASKDYKQSIVKYSEAFKLEKQNAHINDYYNGACACALADLPDSAFKYLFYIADTLKYRDYGHIFLDQDLNNLHTDVRWTSLLMHVKQNKQLAEAGLNQKLIAILDSVYINDQLERKQLNGIEKKYGWGSKEVTDLWKTIHLKDSINIIRVTNILDSFGWLGADEIGTQCNTTLFLVIQHSNQTVQEKYLPMMREAVKNGKARGSSLALLEDRVALGQGKKQIYGSQISQDNETKSYFISPLEDPDNVDKRRAEVGLRPLAEYVKRWNIVWDVEQYKKDMLKMEKKSKQ